MDLNKLARQALTNIKPYVPGKPIEEVKREYGLENVIKLASNENPLGPSPKAVKAIKDSLEEINLYPDGSCYNLTKDLGAFLGVEPSSLIVGNGSDEILKLLAETFINEGDEAIMAEPSFSEYDFCVNLMAGKMIKIPVDRHYVHDLDKMAAAITDKTKLIFICNPNNPTGTIISKEKMAEFMKKVPSHVIIVFDEAYFEYVDDPDYISGLEYLKEDRKNIIVLRTFSKVYGLSGLRIGYGIANPKLIEWVSRAREPFNVNSLAQIAARSALKDGAFLEKSLLLNKTGKKYLYREFQKRNLSYVPTQANFIFVDLEADSKMIFRQLLKQGVIIRTGDIFGYPNYIRVTIGTEAENERFITALDKILKELR